ncbi:hypothetical protein ECAE60S_04317 [Eoetvoesiella caeni]
MRMEMQGHVYPPYLLKIDEDLAKKFLRSMGLESESENVPPTYLIFLRGEAHGVNLFTDLDIPRNRALHGGQKYEWFSPIQWDDSMEVTAKVVTITEKTTKSGPLWIADVEYDYTRAADGELVLRELTRIIKRS